MQNEKTEPFIQNYWEFQEDDNIKLSAGLFWSWDPPGTGWMLKELALNIITVRHKIRPPFIHMTLRQLHYQMIYQRETCCPGLSVSQGLETGQKFLRVLREIPSNIMCLGFLQPTLPLVPKDYNLLTRYTAVGHIHNRKAWLPWRRSAYTNNGPCLSRAAGLMFSVSQLKNWGSESAWWKRQLEPRLLVALLLCFYWSYCSIWSWQDKSGLQRIDLNAP